MLNAIIRFSIRNKLIIGLLTLIWIIWGLWSALHIPIDANPDITNNQVQIITSFSRFGDSRSGTVCNLPY
ncbi:efflux RND transporter permease subunit [Sphingobacterium sp. SG20118]|uniref:efflux RND transporter permease subunit n=1 Tax=Sphingobacterium sp. SG20118 TaxID=3367156 RepID=UPI0037DFC48B